MARVRDMSKQVCVVWRVVFLLTFRSLVIGGVRFTFHLYLLFEEVCSKALDEIVIDRFLAQALVGEEHWRTFSIP